MSLRVAMRRLVDEVVSGYGERSLTFSLPPLVDPRTAAGAVYDAVAGFGPPQRHLDDPSVEGIWVKERLTAGERRHRAGAIRRPGAVVSLSAMRADRG